MVMDKKGQFLSGFPHVDLANYLFIVLHVFFYKKPGKRPSRWVKVS